MAKDTVPEAIRAALISPNVPDDNLEPANIVDVVNRLSRMTLHVADAITARAAANGSDAMGGTVGSLTEAVMGITAGLAKVAEAIHDLAEAVRERRP